MFTGIIEEVGTVKETERGRLVIGCQKILRGTNLGDSIAINGVDLTVAQMEEDSFLANVMPETYRRSNLGQLKPGDLVNLERSLYVGARISGHIVRGVVEATGSLLSLTPEEDAVIARYAATPQIMRYVVVTGPIAIDGVSLTIIAKDEGSFSVSLVRYTMENTNLTRKQLGDAVNLESDIIARYVEQLLPGGGQELQGASPD
jgi:riboflavin synthase